MFKYELDPTKIELKNTDFEHKLDLNYGNNGAEFITVPFKKSKLDKLLVTYQNYIDNIEYLDKELLFNISVMEGHIQNGFNAEYIQGKLNSINSDLEEISIYKTSIFTQIDNNKKINPFFISIINNRVKLDHIDDIDDVRTLFDNSPKEELDNFYHLYHVVINEKLYNLEAKNKHLEITLRDIIYQFENGFTKKEKVENNKRKSRLKEEVFEKSEIIVMDVLKEDDGVDINRKLEPEKKKKKSSIIIGDALTKRKKALKAKKISLKEREAILRGLQEDDGLRIDEEKQLNSLKLNISDLESEEKGLDKKIDYNNNEIDRLAMLEKRFNNNNGQMMDLPKKNKVDRRDDINKRLNAINKRVYSIVNQKIISDAKIKEVPDGIIKNTPKRRLKRTHTLLIIFTIIFVIIFAISYYSKK